MEKVASEGAHGEDDAFYAEKADKDNELAKRSVKKNLDTKSFTEDICRVETRNVRSKITSEERKQLCLAAYSMLDLKYSAWFFNSPDYSRSVLSWERHFEQLLYGPAGEKIRDIVLNVCKDTALLPNRDPILSFVYLMKSPPKVGTG
jgi:hypothetical protein